MLIMHYDKVFRLPSVTISSAIIIECEGDSPVFILSNK
jgi:hypothetical protein